MEQNYYSTKTSPRVLNLNLSRYLVFLIHFFCLVLFLGRIHTSDGCHSYSGLWWKDGITMPSNQSLSLRIYRVENAKLCWRRTKDLRDNHVCCRVLIIWTWFSRLDPNALKGTVHPKSKITVIIISSGEVSQSAKHFWSFTALQRSPKYQKQLGIKKITRKYKMLHLARPLTTVLTSSWKGCKVQTACKGCKYKMHPLHHQKEERRTLSICL